jgi:hypothetical protein
VLALCVCVCVCVCVRVCVCVCACACAALHDSILKSENTGATQAGSNGNVSSMGAVTAWF